MPMKEASYLRFGPFEVDLETHELWKYGTRLKLVGQPFEILSLLLSRPGELVTREQLRSRLWPADTFVDFNHGLNAGVNKLREVLGDSADTPSYVETLPRRGYRFIATVERAAQRTPTSTGEKLKDIQILQPSARSPAFQALGGAAKLRFEGPDEEAASFSKAQPLIEVAWSDQVPVQSSDAKSKLSRPYFAIITGFLLLVIAATLILRLLSGSGAAREQLAMPQQVRALTNLNDATSDPAFSPNGNFVAFRRESVRGENSGIFVK